MFFRSSIKISITVCICYLLLFIQTNPVISDDEDCRCSFQGSRIICKGVNSTGNNEYDALSTHLQCLSESQRQEAITLEIVNYSMLLLNLTVIEAHSLTLVSNITLDACNISTIIGEISCKVAELRLSNNSIRSFSAVLHDSRNTDCDGVEGDLWTLLCSDQNTEGTSGTSPICANASLDLRDNLLEELSIEMFSSPRLQSLWLSGNPLKCEFIWEDVWEQLGCQNRSMDCRRLFVDQNTTKCQFYRQNLVPSGIFHYSLAQLFDSKITLEEECSEMNKTCGCHPFNLLRSEGDNKPTVYLTVNCFGKNLTELPLVSEYTWELNVSHNFIADLSRLNSSEYRNLRRLDLSNNDVSELTHLANTGFMKRFDLLYVNSNKFLNIPDIFLNNIKHSEGKAMLKIGNELECECHTASHTKRRMIAVQNNIIDLSDVLCRNIMPKDDPEDPDDDINMKSTFLRLKDLNDVDVCPLPSSEYGTLDWILLIIILEILGIFGVLLKVLYDWKEYQRTGILPWIAGKLPRLPCDGILE